jgi:dipeptidyl aminopeptidase/acylaminoacyl peptidase
MTRWIAMLGACFVTHVCADPMGLPALSDAERIVVEANGVRMGSYLFRPEIRNDAVPAVLVVHGWGGNATDHVYEARRLAAELGFVTLAITMRGFDGADGEDDCGAEQSVDVAEVLAWLGALPGVDPDRLGVVGFSQGGQVALLAAARSPRVKSVVAYYPVTDISDWKVTTRYPRIPGYIEETCEPRGLDALSPVNVADRIVAPVLLIHGSRDERVPIAQSQRLHARLLQGGRSSSLIVIPGARHGFTDAETRMAFAAAREHLRRTLGAR